MELTGQVVDLLTGEGVPGATVELWYSNVLLSRVAANNSGIFTIRSQSSPDKIVITSASYSPGSYRYPGSGNTFELVRNVAEGEPVTIRSTIKKKGGFAWLLLALMLLLNRK